MNLDDEEILKLLEQIASNLGSRQSVTLKEIENELKKHNLKNKLKLDDVVIYLSAEGIVVLDLEQISKLENPLLQYFSDISNVEILGKEREIEIAKKMKYSFNELQALIACTTISIFKFLKKGRELETGSISIDDFTLSSFRLENRTPTEHKKEILMKLKRIEILYFKKLCPFIRSIRKASIGKKTYWERKARYSKEILKLIKEINPAFKIIESILPLFSKILMFREKEQEQLEKALLISGISLEQARKLMKCKPEEYMERFEELGIGRKSMNLITKHFRRFKRIDRCISDISCFPTMILFEKLNKIPELLSEYEESRELLFNANVRLIVNVAHSYMNQGVDFLDLIQEGNHALLKAIERFDPNKGYKIATYGIWWIKQFMLRILAEQGHAMRLPIYLIQWTRKHSKVVQELTQKLGRKPTKSEIAQALEITEKNLNRILKSIRVEISLDKKLGVEEDSRTIGDLIKDVSVEPPCLKATLFRLKEEIKGMLRTLDDREAKIITLRYGLEDNWPRTLDEIARIFSLSRERIRQIEYKALTKLKKPSRLRNLERFLKEEYLFR